MFAVDGIKCCRACDVKREQIILEKESIPSAIQSRLQSNSQKLFLNPMQPYRYGIKFIQFIISVDVLSSRPVFQDGLTRGKTSTNSAKSQSSQSYMKRNLAAKYIGPPYKL